MTNQELISCREAADVLGVDPSTITRMVKRGALDVAHKGPGIRGPYVFDRSVVAKYATARAAR